MKGRRTKRRKGVSIKRGVRASKVWINPNCTFKGPRSNRAWEHPQLSPPTAARLLELADVALGSSPAQTEEKKKKFTA